MLQQSIDFRSDRKRATERVCRLAEALPVYALTFSEASNVPEILNFLASPSQTDAAMSKPASPGKGSA
jgi:hypothetical protein